MPDYPGADRASSLGADLIKLNRREIGQTAACFPFNQNISFRTNLLVEMPVQRSLACSP
jgi:hypothetical protein